MIKYSHKFLKVKLADLPEEIKSRKNGDWHFIQMCCTKTETDHELVYSFIKNGVHEDFVVNVKDKDKVPSITGDFIAAFVFENEAHDLFGIKFIDLAIDFKGKFYKLAKKEPMEVVTPEVIARREKQKKIEAAMAAKKAKDANKATTDKKAKDNAPKAKTEEKPASVASMAQAKKGEGE